MFFSNQVQSLGSFSGLFGCWRIGPARKTFSAVHAFGQHNNLDLVRAHCATNTKAAKQVEPTKSKA